MFGPACESCGHATDPWVIDPACSLWRCPRCAHVMRDLARCRAGAREHPWGGSGAFDRVRHTFTARRLRRMLPKAGQNRILEIGFGRGALLARFQRRGNRVTGIDPGMLDRDLDRGLLRNATLHASRAEDVSLSDRAFDLIYGIHVVEHLDDPAVVLRTCRRALGDGGVLYLVTPNARSAGLTLFRGAWWNLEDPTHVRFFSPASLTTMLAAAGFEDITVRRPFWDSLTLEISSMVRVFRKDGGEHGVLASRWVMPLYVVLLPLALLARLIWPRLTPSMEVIAR